MLKRMWRAFWVAMREPVKRYAPEQTITLNVEVNDGEAQVRLDRLIAKAKELRRLQPRGKRG